MDILKFYPHSPVLEQFVMNPFPVVAPFVSFRASLRASWKQAVARFPAT